MKTTNQIALDCGMDAARANWLHRILSRPDEEDSEVGHLESIIGALYRRIEKLDYFTDAQAAALKEQDRRIEGLEGYEADYRAMLSKILLRLDDLGYGNSSLSIADNILQTLGEQRARIETLEEEKECHIAEIKALESAVAGNAERINNLILSGGKE